jgi:hypothetical protein
VKTYCFDFGVFVRVFFMKAGRFMSMVTPFPIDVG